MQIIHTLRLSIHHQKKNIVPPCLPNVTMPLSAPNPSFWLLHREVRSSPKHFPRSLPFSPYQGVSCICSAFSGVAAGRLATAGGQAYLLLAAALSLGTITVTAVALTPVKAGGGGGEKIEGKTLKKKSDYGMLSVLR